MRRSKYDATLLGPIVAAATSLAGVIRALGLTPTGGNYRHISARVRLAGLDISHFKGQGWSRGSTRASHPSVDRVSRKNETPDEQVFVENGPPFGGRVLTS